MLIFGVMERAKNGLIPIPSLSASDVTTFRFGQYETSNIEECYDIVEKVTGKNYADEYDEDYVGFVKFLYANFPTLVHGE